MGTKLVIKIGDAFYQSSNTESLSGFKAAVDFLLANAFRGYGPEDIVENERGSSWFANDGLDCRILGLCPTP